MLEEEVRIIVKAYSTSEVEYYDIAREMTKKYEQLLRGRAEAVTDKKFKKEITVVLKFA